MKQGIMSKIAQISGILFVCLSGAATDARRQKIRFGAVDLSHLQETENAIVRKRV